MALLTSLELTLRPIRPLHRQPTTRKPNGLSRQRLSGSSSTLSLLLRPRKSVLRTPALTLPSGSTPRCLRWKNRLIKCTANLDIRFNDCGDCGSVETILYVPKYVDICTLVELF